MHQKRRHTSTSCDPLSLMVTVAHAMRRSRLGTISSFARLAGVSRQSVYRTLAFMAAYGFARNDNGTWKLTDKEAA